MTNLIAEKCREQFEQWFRDIEAGDDPNWSSPPYLSREWHDYLARRQLSLGAWDKAIEIALTVLEQQGVIGRPVAWLNDAYLARGVVDGEAGEDDAGPGYIPVYRHPQNATPQLKTDTYRQIENDGWIDWGGGDCPVAPDTIVTLKLFDDSLWHEYPAKEWNWHDTTRLDHIIAYRVIENDGREG